MKPIPLPDDVARLLDDGEVAYWHAQPIRHANGRGVWLIMAIGIVFAFASAGALVEVLTGIVSDGSFGPGALASLALALLFAGFSLLLLAWPLLSYARMRRTHVVVTDRRVVSLVLPRASGKGPRARAWAHAECTDLSVARRRGASATLVLRERLRTRATDGQTVYEWDALHGLPDADSALSLLRALRGEG